MKNVFYVNEFKMNKVKHRRLFHDIIALGILFCKSGALFVICLEIVLEINSNKRYVFVLRGKQQFSYRGDLLLSLCWNCAMSA